MPAGSPVRLDLLKAAVHDAAAAVLGTQAELIWSDQGAPRPGRPYVAMRILSGPSRVDGTIHDIRQMRSAATSTSVDLGAAVDGTRYRVRVNGQAFDETAGATSTVTTVRNAHIALVNASSQPATAIAAGGPGEITLTPDAPGSIIDLDAQPSASYTLTPTGEAFVIDHVSPRQVVITFDVYVGTGIAELGTLDVGAYALDLAAQLETGFTLTSTQDLLRNRRVTYLGPAGSPLNLTGVAATLNEGRASVDLTFGVAAFRTESTSVIEQAEITVVVDGLTFTETIDTTP